MDGIPLLLDLSGVDDRNPCILPGITGVIKNNLHKLLTLWSFSGHSLLSEVIFSFKKVAKAGGAL